MRMTTVLMAGLAAFLASGVAAAQNLVANGDFDVSVASWTPGLMTFLGWSSTDWQGDPTSGSALMTNAAPCGSTGSSQCVTLPLPLAASYELGAAVFLFQSTIPQASAHVTVLAHEGTSCAGLPVGSFQGPIVTVPDQWISFLNPGIQLPPSTQSVTISLSVAKPFLPGCVPLPSASALFDHVRFGPTGTTPVTMQSFSVE
jgi:hypothetical protein